MTTPFHASVVFTAAEDDTHAPQNQLAQILSTHLSQPETNTQTTTASRWHEHVFAAWGSVVTHFFKPWWHCRWQHLETAFGCSSTDCAARAFRRPPVGASLICVVCMTQCMQKWQAGQMSACTPWHTCHEAQAQSCAFQTKL